MLPRRGVRGADGQQAASLRVKMGPPWEGCSLGPGCPPPTADREKVFISDPSGWLLQVSGCVGPPCRPPERARFCVWPISAHISENVGCVRSECHPNPHKFG